MSKKNKVCRNIDSKINNFKSLTKAKPEGDKRFKKTWKEFLCSKGTHTSSQDYNNEIASVGKKAFGPKIYNEYKGMSKLDFVGFYNNETKIYNYGIILEIFQKISLSSLKIGMEVGYFQDGLGNEPEEALVIENSESKLIIKIKQKPNEVLRTVELLSVSKFLVSISIF